MNNQHVDNIEKNLTEVSDRDSLLTIGRSYLTRAKAQGVTRADIKPLLTEAFGDDDTDNTTSGRIK